MNSTVTNTPGSKIGTALYMSPEQTEGVVSKIGAWDSMVYTRCCLFGILTVGTRQFDEPCFSQIRL